MTALSAPPVACPTGASTWTCPDCALPLAMSGGCALCTACGWSPCG